MEKRKKNTSEAQIAAFILRVDNDDDELVRFSEFMEIFISKKTNLGEDKRTSPRSNLHKNTSKTGKLQDQYLSYLKEHYASPSKRSPSQSKGSQSQENFFSPRSTQASFTSSSPINKLVKQKLSKVTFNIKTEYIKAMSSHSVSISKSQNTTLTSSKNTLKKMPTSFIIDDQVKKEYSKHEPYLRQSSNYGGSPQEDEPVQELQSRENRLNTLKQLGPLDSNIYNCPKIIVNTAARNSNLDLGVTHKRVEKVETRHKESFRDEEKAIIVEVFKDMIEHIYKVENLKNDLASRKDFNFFNVFAIFDIQKKGKIDKMQLQQGLLKLDVYATPGDIDFLMKKLDEDLDGLIRYLLFKNTHH